MTFDEYQEAARRTAKMGRGGQMTADDFFVLCALGLAGETGEIVEPVKKHAFHGRPIDREALLEEAGDVLWYLTTLIETLGGTLETVAAANVAKLALRYPASPSAVTVEEVPIEFRTRAIADGVQHSDECSAVAAPLCRTDCPMHAAWVRAGRPAE